MASPPLPTTPVESLVPLALSDHDAARDMVLCAVKAAMEYEPFELPMKTLDPTRQDQADQAGLEDLTAEQAHALVLGNAWAKPFKTEVERANEVAAILSSLWRRSLTPYEDLRLRTFYWQARMEGAVQRMKVEWDQTIPQYLDPPGDDFIIVARSTDWIPRDRAMDFESVGIDAFRQTWHLGVDDGSNTRRSATPTPRRRSACATAS